MASLFSPESEKLRQAQKEKAQGAKGFSVPGNKGNVGKGDKSGDSLGNPNSPGYQGPFKKKKPEEEKNAPVESALPEVPGTVIEPTEMPAAKFIRLSVGWEKLLITQKKICEKAKNLFRDMDAPESYQKQKRGKISALKSRGCIVNLDIETLRQELDAKEKAEKGKKSA